MNQLSYTCRASSSLTSGVALVSSSATQPVSGEAANPASSPRTAAWPHPSVLARMAVERTVLRSIPLLLLRAFPADFAQPLPYAPRQGTGRSQLSSRPSLDHPCEKRCRVPLAPSLPGPARRTTSGTPVCSSPHEEPSPALPKKPRHLFCMRNEAAKTRTHRLSHHPIARGLGWCHLEQHGLCWVSSPTQMHIPELVREFNMKY